MKVRKLVIASMLIAIGIIIPLFSPIKIIMEPASFTLASHVAIFIAMFISPTVAIAVALGTALGFFMSTTVVIALRAISQIGFVLVGSYLLYKRPGITRNPQSNFMFALLLGIIHAIGEVTVTSFFYFGGMAATGYYAKGYVYTILGLVGVGTLIHSMVDYYIAFAIKKRLEKTDSELLS